MRFERKVSSGYFATSRKSADRRWASRSATCVSIDAASMRTSTDERVRSFSSSSIEPDHLAKRPCTFEMTMWRTQKWTAEWPTSMSQRFVAMSAFLLSVVRRGGARYALDMRLFHLGEQYRD